jgi:hypothetical protein
LTGRRFGLPDRLVYGPHAADDQGQTDDGGQDRDSGKP